MVVPAGIRRVSAEYITFSIPLLIPLFICLTISRAMFLDRPVGNEYAGTSGAGAACGFHRISVSGNPASLLSGKTGFSFSRYRPWQLDELHVTEAGLFYDGRNWGTSLSALQTDVSAIYLEHTFQIQLAILVRERLVLGLAPGLRRLEVRGFGSALYPGDAVGAQWFLLPAFSAGIFARDLLSAGFLKENASPIFQAGFLLQMPAGFTVSYDMRRNRNHRWRHHIGQTLNFRNTVRIAAGIASNPYQFSLGLSILLKQIGIHNAIQANQNLGKTHHYGISGIY